MAVDASTELASDLRGRVLDAAEALGHEFGEQGITMRQIATRVGVSPTALYQVFENKAELLHEVELRFHDQLDAALARIPSDGFDSRAKLHKICLAYVEVARRDPWRYQLAFRNAEVESGALTREPPEGFLRHAIGCLIDDPDASGAAIRIWVALHGLVTATARSSSGEWNDDERRFVDRYLRMMLR